MLGLVLATWVAFYGGECPVPLNEPVDVMFRDGQIIEGQSYFARTFNWTHQGKASDIVAYRKQK